MVSKWGAKNFYCESFEKNTKLCMSTVTIFWLMFQNAVLPICTQNTCHEFAGKIHRSVCSLRHDWAKVAKISNKPNNPTMTLTNKRTGVTNYLRKSKNYVGFALRPVAFWDTKLEILQSTKVHKMSLNTYRTENTLESRWPKFLSFSGYD